MLRYVLVAEPDGRCVDAMKRCFLLGIAPRTFRVRQLKLGLAQLTDKILNTVAVRDDALLVCHACLGSALSSFVSQRVALEGCAAFLAVEHALLGEDVQTSVEVILEKLQQVRLLALLPDDFVASLLIENAGLYYLNLTVGMKTEYKE